MGTLPWSIKSLALWKRLNTEYGSATLLALIERWMITSKNPAKFEHFYFAAPKLYNEIKEKDYKWE